MKTIIAALIGMTALTASAHEIEGTLMLKGSLKTETRISYTKATCKVKIDDVKNLMEEDQFGNPAYKVKLEVNLSAGDFFDSKKIRYEKKATLTNLFPDGVRDLEYHGDGLTLKINREGRLVEVLVPTVYSKVSCKF